MTNPLDINILAERISAQTEAYEKFALALARILELLDEIKENLHDQGLDNSDTLKGLVKAITVIGTQLEAYMVFTRDNDALIVQNLSDYNKYNQQFVIELQAQRDNLSDATDTFKTLDVSLKNQFAEVNQRLAAALDGIGQLKNEHNKVSAQVNSIYKTKLGWGITLRHWKIYAVAIITILGLFGGAIQLGFVSLKWGNSDNPAPNTRQMP